MRYFKKINGERIYLSPMNKDDVEIYTKWLNTYDVSGNLGMYTQTISLSSEQKYLESLASGEQNFAIVTYDGDTLIGNIGFNEIDNISRRASVGLFIGEPENRGKGYGTEALSLILNYGFRELNYRNIMLRVHSDNEQGIDCYKKVGFNEFGRRHEAQYKNGKYIDVIYMEILSEEFIQ
jgi:RimJ/RimL family protein N-acetyltransferase